MEVAVHYSGYVGHVRYYGEDFLQVKLVQPDGKVLQGFGVPVVRIYVHSRSVVGHELQFGRHATVGSHVQEVVVVHLELLVAEYRVVGQHVHLDAVLLHRRFHAELHAEAVLRVVEPDVGSRAFSEYISVEQGVEYVLLVFPVVSYLRVVRTVGRVGIDVEAHGVECHGAVLQFDELYVAVEAEYGRR